MKKLCLSLGAILLSGLVLASCNGVKINKPKSKGGAVDNINVALDSQTLEINKDDKFGDVYSALSMYGYFSVDNEESDEKYEFSYKSKSSTSGKVTYTNYVDEDNQYLYKKYSSTVKKSAFEENYFKGEDINGNYKYETYYNYVSKEKLKKESSEETKIKEVNDTVTFGGSYSDDRGVRSVDIGCFTSNTKNQSTKSKTSKDVLKDTKKQYTYVNESENPSDEHYNDSKYGYDNDGNYYEYSISSFEEYYEYPMGFPLGRYLLYNESIDDLCDYSFELTDNYIIIKGSSKATPTVFRELHSYIDAETQDEFFTKAKSLLESDYKGSKVDVEIWIDYTRDSITEGKKMLTLSYAKYKEVYKVNYKRTYDDRMLQMFGFAPEFEEEIKGKEYTAKGSVVTTGEIGGSSDNYTKKIQSFQKKAKKNNIYDKITFFYAD